MTETAQNFTRQIAGSYSAILADSPWRFQNRTGKMAPGRRQVNIIPTRKEKHSKKPDELYHIIEQCSPGPFLELFARTPRKGWTQWGNEIPTPSIPPKNNV